MLEQIKNNRFAAEKLFQKSNLLTNYKKNNMSENSGKVSQIIGPVVDVTFENNEQGLPDIYDSLVIKKENGEDLVLECQQHIGEDTVRTISMDST